MTDADTTLARIAATLDAVQPVPMPFGMAVYPHMSVARQPVPADRPPSRGAEDVLAGAVDALDEVGEATGGP